MKRYEIIYEYSSTRKMTVEANSRVEARLKFYEGDFISDTEENADDGRIVDLMEE